MDVILADDRTWKRVAGPLAIFVVGAWALVASWALGPDVQVDFGRELYVPWRLSEGDRLYEDVAFFNGPLSVYWHALWFSVAGVGLSTIKVLNLVNVAVTAALILHIFTRLSDRYAGAIAGVFFVGALAFAQLQPVGNFDYLTPYSHELVHGIALALLALREFLHRDRHAATTTAAVRCGAIAALVFLTKIEVFAALAGALVVGFALDSKADAKPSVAIGKLVVALARSFLGVLVLAGCVLALAVGPGVALRGIFEPLHALLGSSVTGLTYYRWVMGTLDPSRSLWEIVGWLLRYAVVLLPLAGLSLLWRRQGLDRFAPVVGLLLVAAAVVFPLAPALAVDSIRPLPVVIPVLLALLVREFAARRSRDLVVAICVLVFGLVLQCKMLLNAQFGHYGFALLMPSTLVWIVALVGWMPAWIERRGGSGAVFRLGASAAVLAVALGLIARTDANFARRTEPIGRAADAFRSDFRTHDMARALAFLERLDADASIAVLPEGVMLNYLARRVNPTPYINFMPPELSLYGSETIIRAFRENPPDYVLLVHKRTGLYGVPFFGRDYGRALYGWVLSNYRRVEAYGGPPFEEGTRFGIVILARRDLERSRG